MRATGTPIWMAATTVQIARPGPPGRSRKRRGLVTGGSLGWMGWTKGGRGFMGAKVVLVLVLMRPTATHRPRPAEGSGGVWHTRDPGGGRAKEGGRGPPLEPEGSLPQPGGDEQSSRKALGALQRAERAPGRRRGRGVPRPAVKGPASSEKNPHPVAPVQAHSNPKEGKQPFRGKPKRKPANEILAPQKFAGGLPELRANGAVNDPVTNQRHGWSPNPRSPKGGAGRVGVAAGPLASRSAGDVRQPPPPAGHTGEGEERWVRSQWTPRPWLRGCHATGCRAPPPPPATGAEKNSPTLEKSSPFNYLPVFGMKSLRSLNYAGRNSVRTDE